MTTENTIISKGGGGTKKTWAEVVMGHRKPVRSQPADGSKGSNRFTRSTGTQMKDAIRERFKLFSHTVEEIKQFCMDYLRVGRWTRKIWKNCSFPQFMRKSGVYSYLTIEEREKIGIENPFVCRLKRARRIPVAPCLRYGRDRTDFNSSKLVDYACLMIDPTSGVMHKICEDGISKYYLIIMNTVTGKIQKKQLKTRYLTVEKRRTGFGLRMSNLTGADLIVTISDNGKNVYETLMPKTEINYSDDRTCTICLEDVDPAGAFIPACGHMFHVSCMSGAAYSAHGRSIFPDVRVNLKCTNHACEHTMMTPMSFKCPMCRGTTNVNV